MIAQQILLDRHILQDIIHVLEGRHRGWTDPDDAAESVLDRLKEILEEHDHLKE